jgi:hypothetical protein
VDFDAQTEHLLAYLGGELARFWNKSGEYKQSLVSGWAVFLDMQNEFRALKEDLERAVGTVLALRERVSGVE